MRILIITYFFPPLNSIASLRPYSWAKYFPEYGLDVTVLTPTKYKFSNDLDLNFDNFKLCEIPIPKTFKLVSFGKLINFLNERFSLGIYYKVRFPDDTFRWVKPAFSWAKNYYWDVVISTGLPYTVHEIGYLLKKNNRCKVWVADWRDLFSENPIFTGLPILRYYEKSLEKRYNNTADLITTVSEGLKKYWTNTTSKPVEVIYNGFFEEDFDSIGDTRVENSKISILYAGTFYRSWLVSYFFEALKELRQEGVINPHNFEFIVFGAFNIEKYIEKYGLKEIFRFGGFVKREKVLNSFTHSDFLFFPLSEERDLPNWKGILTGKLFEYLGVNLYVNKPIMVVGKTYDVEKVQILNNSGCCLFLDNKESIKNMLKKYIKERKFDVFPNKEFIGYFSRRNQAKIFLRKIMEIYEKKS
ncbi:MAG: hypothetical protein RMJ36_05620 [Candidatus Calescibacterium sp.]|nr:hypothetical protein [Candidatus Calescibacterium sp.]MDW8133115.1 hypothetical protein [Candidatus Calescibacterium sp.]